MKHKKQAHEQIEQTIKWNEIRGNTSDTLDWDLEISMLQEELDELSKAVNANDKVGIFDALLDLKFVLLGSCGKFGLTPEMVVEGYEYVLKANNKKSKSKNQFGKITKPDNFVGPEPELQALLDSYK